MADQTEIQEAATTVYPTAKAGWFLVIMLTIAYIFSFIDRYILGLLIEPIKADLGLTDEQIGWVIGPAFAIFYATMGLPLGWLVDRSRRTWIVAAGIFVWSLATAVSGLAKNFWHLFIARMMVGVGEATLSPSAMSMIADSFPPEKRGKPISVYVAALSLGSGIASLIGGAVLIWAKTTESVAVPFFGALAPWQLTFFAVGLPGLLLGLVFMFIKEPPRQAAELDSDLDGNSISDALKYVGRRIGTYGTFVSMAAVMAIIAYSQGFLPATFERTWGWPAEKYALINGVALLIFGPATVFITGVISDRWTQAGIKDASLRLLIIGYVIMLPTAILPMFMPTPEIAYAILCLNTVGIAMISGMAITALLAITPGQIRGQVVALYYMAISMAGLFLGPSTVGILSTRVFGEENIRLAMATLPVVYGLVPLLLIPLAIKFYRRQLDHIDAQQVS
ncbi:MAG: MFS transporter [Parasphingorhabdus sp.]